MDKRQIEKNIVFAYSAYTLALTAAAAVLQWPAWIIPVIITEMMICWFIYGGEKKDYRYRAFCYAGFAMITFGIYAGMSDSFSSILTTMAAFVIVMGLFGVPEIMFVAMGFSILILLFHFFVRENTIPSLNKFQISICVKVTSILLELSHALMYP